MICHNDLLDVTHMDIYIINQNSYVKSDAIFGLDDNSWKVKIKVLSIQSHIMAPSYSFSIYNNKCFIMGDIKLPPYKIFWEGRFR